MVKASFGIVAIIIDKKSQCVVGFDLYPVSDLPQRVSYLAMSPVVVWLPLALVARLGS